MADEANGHLGRETSDNHIVTGSRRPGGDVALPWKPLFFFFFFRH